MKKLLVTATALSGAHEARGGKGGNKLPSKPSLVVQIGPESPEDTFFEEN